MYTSQAKKKLKSNQMNFTNSTVNQNPISTGSLALLTLPEVGTRIKIKDIESIKRWLSKYNIMMYKLSKQICVYEIDLDCEIDKIRVRDLRMQHPNNWEEVYKSIAKDKSVFEMVVTSLGGEVASKPSTRVKLKSDYEKELLKKYNT
jgi:hypothetical protein